MTHKILERRGIVKKTIYNPRYPIATVLSAAKELLEFFNITGTLYTQEQAVNITYVILHRTGNLELEICKWNHKTTVQRTWVRFTHLFWTAHWELRETSDTTVEDVGMHKTNLVNDMVAGSKEVLQQEEFLT